jgi:hypothetical protein
MPAGVLMPPSLLRIRIQLHPRSSRMANKKYHGLPLSYNEGNEMTIASDLLQQHIQTLVDDNARWQTLIADNILWELAYAPSLGPTLNPAGRSWSFRWVGRADSGRSWKPRHAPGWLAPDEVPPSHTPVGRRSLVKNSRWRLASRGGSILACAEAKVD